MATGTNGIATEGEAKSKLGYSGSVDTNKCCTKARAIAMGADSSKLSAYKDNQLVKYSDIQPAKIYYTVTVKNSVNSNVTISSEIDSQSIEYNESMNLKFDPENLPLFAWTLKNRGSSIKCTNDIHFNMEVNPTGNFTLSMLNIRVEIISLKGNATITYSKAL